MPSTAAETGDCVCMAHDCRHRHSVKLIKGLRQDRPTDRPRRPQIQMDERFAFDQATEFGSITIQRPSSMTMIAKYRLFSTGILYFFIRKG